MSVDPLHREVGPDEDGQRLDRWLRKHLPALSFGEAQRWARTGQVRVDGKRAKADQRLTAGAVVRLPSNATRGHPHAASPREAAAGRHLKRGLSRANFARSPAGWGGRAVKGKASPVGGPGGWRAGRGCT